MNFFAFFGSFISLICAVITLGASYVFFNYDYLLYGAITTLLFIISVICLIGNIRTFDFKRN